MSPLSLAITLCVIGFVLSAIYSGAETGAYRFNRTRHRLALSQAERSATSLESLVRDLTGFVVVCLIGTNLANTLVSFSATLGLESLGVQAPELVSTVTVGPLLFIMGELAPKELFRRHPDRLLYASLPLLRLSSVVFRPAVRALSVVSHALRVLGLKTEDGRNLAGEERLRQAIASGAEGGTLTAYQTTLARNIFRLRQNTVRSAMTPLARADCLERSTAIEEARAFVSATGRGRYPVYVDRRSEVVGLLSLYDLLFEERPGLTIRNYVQPALYVGPDEKVAEALVRLRRARTHMAIVSEGRRAIGIITMKDLVEEITGELQDL